MISVRLAPVMGPEAAGAQPPTFGLMSVSIDGRLAKKLGTSS
jgi:hypothetical protein